MGIIDDIRRMQNEARTEQEIMIQLQNQGHGQKEIYEALAQAKIKNAVAGAESGTGEENHDSPNGNPMEPSMLNNVASEEPQSPELEMQEIIPQPYPAQQYTQPYTAPAQAESYANQAYYSAPSADAITEIAEQIVAERIGKINQEMARSTENRQIIETKLEYIDERLKKIEKIIDRLQLSILQKVGEYMTNVEDLKTEVVETQKSFKTLLASHSPKMQKTEERIPMASSKQRISATTPQQERNESV